LSSKASACPAPISRTTAASAERRQERAVVAAGALPRQAWRPIPRIKAEASTSAGEPAVQRSVRSANAITLALILILAAGGAALPVAEPSWRVSGDLNEVRRVYGGMWAIPSGAGL